MLSEISQTEKDKYCMVSLIRGTLQKASVIGPEIRRLVFRGWEEGEWGDGGQRAPVCG